MHHSRRAGAGLYCDGMERCIDVHLRLHFSPATARAALIAAFLLSCAGDLASESVTLTTYYPAPSGVYTQLVATSNAYMARDNPASFLDVGTNAVPPSVSGVGSVKMYVVGNEQIANGYGLVFGNGSLIQSDQGGSLELGGNNGTAGVGVPYIDFHYGGAGVQDFNVRLINDANNQMSVYGSGGTGALGLNVGGRIGTSGFSPTSGYPGGWGGGIHTWDVYSEGTIGVGHSGSLSSYVSNNGYFYGNGSTCWATTSDWNSGTDGVCAAGSYASWTPGVYSEGWSYSGPGVEALSSPSALTLFSGYFVCCSK